MMHTAEYVHLSVGLLEGVVFISRFYSAQYLKTAVSIHVRSHFVIIWLLLSSSVQFHLGGFPSVVIWSWRFGLDQVFLPDFLFYITHMLYVCVCVCVVVWLSPQSLGCSFDRRPWKVKELHKHSQAPFCMKTIFWSCILLFSSARFLSANLLSRQQQIEAAYNYFNHRLWVVYTLSR